MFESSLATFEPWKRRSGAPPPSVLPIAAVMLAATLCASCISENTEYGGPDASDLDGNGLDDEGTDGSVGRMRPQSNDTGPSATVVLSSDAGANEDAKGPPGLINVRAACDMRADQQCMRLQQCSEFFLRMAFGKNDNCRARISSSCVEEAMAADVSISTYTLIKCARDTVEQTCEDLIDRREPDACRPLGIRKEGKGCASDLQCATGFCSFEAKSCGTCKVKRGMNESCASDSGCTTGLYCSAKGKCVRKGTIGAPCGADGQDCVTLLSCMRGKCAEPLAAGSACQNTEQCRRDLGQVCDSTATLRPLVEPTSMCRPSLLATNGEVCREGDNITAYCASGPSNCLADKLGVYRCVEAARDGEACGDKAGGRNCMLPASCVSGICRLGPTISCVP
jgi:hypothetical protein